MIKRWMVLLLVLGSLALAPMFTARAMAETAPNVEQAAGHKQEPLLPNPTEKETILRAVWVIIIFLVLLAILYPTAWKNVLSGLKAREERIRKDLADAEERNRKAEARLKEYEAKLAAADAQVRETITRAIADGEKAAADIKLRATQEVEEAKGRATREIEAAKKQAMGEIYAQAAEISTQIAGKILQREIRPEDQQELVKRSLEQLNPN